MFAFFLNYCVGFELEKLSNNISHLDSTHFIILKTDRVHALIQSATTTQVTLNASKAISLQIFLKHMVQEKVH